MVPMGRMGCTFAPIAWCCNPAVRSVAQDIAIVTLYSGPPAGVWPTHPLYTRHSLEGVGYTEVSLHWSHTSPVHETAVEVLAALFEDESALVANGFLPPILELLIHANEDQSVVVRH